MPAFIDSGMFVAAYNTRDSNHKSAQEIIKAAIDGRHGPLYTSDYVFDEAVTLMLARTKNPKHALGLGLFILGDPSKQAESFAQMISVDEDAFKESWSLFRKYAARGLSFTDCTILALMKRENIDTLLSFDRSFDGIVQRVG